MPPATTTDGTKTTTTAVPPAPACTASDLTPTFLGSNGAAGTIVLGFALKNTGSTTCHTYGWPGVELLSASGGGAADQRDPHDEGRGSAPRPPTVLDAEAGRARRRSG